MNTSEGQRSKYTKMLGVACVGIAICMIFTARLNFIAAIIAYDDKRCDLSLTTANDFTV
jgi:hypothetical protein